MNADDPNMVVHLLAGVDTAIEVGIGARPGLAAALQEAGVSVTAVDLKDRAVPPGVTFIQGDIRSDRTVEALPPPDLVYARRLPEELQPGVARLAEQLEAPLYFTTLGFEYPVLPVERVPTGGVTWYRHRRAVSTSTLPPPTHPRRMEADAIVSDIDGVLLDTSESYHRAIVESVAATYGGAIARSDIQPIKDAGGFNNDWKTTDALALFVLAKQEGYEGGLEVYADGIRERGGGIGGAKALIRDEFEPERRARVLEKWDPEGLRRTFQWLYLGPDRYAQLEDGPPPAERPRPTGLMDDEPILLDPDTKTSIGDDWELGILTGRPRAEAEIAIARLECDPPDDRVVTMDDWDGGKPEPDGLIQVASACNGERIVYVGDELDDVRTAVRADRADESRQYSGVGVLTGGLSGKSGRQALLDAGAAAVLESINELPDLLSED